MTKPLLAVGQLTELRKTSSAVCRYCASEWVRTAISSPSF